jgi:hypothetical protein
VIAKEELRVDTYAFDSKTSELGKVTL